jgi:hypothetical protein
VCFVIGGAEGFAVGDPMERTVGFGVGFVEGFSVSLDVGLAVGFNGGSSVFFFGSAVEPGF